MDFIYPTQSSPTTLNFQAGQKPLLFCTGGEIPRITNDVDRSLEEYQCVRNTTFSSSRNKTQSFNHIVCSKNPNPVEKEDKTRRCKNGIVVNIGYQITSRVFKKTIDLCHSTELSTTFWAHSRIPSVIGNNKNSDFRAPAFSKGSYFKDVRITKVYPKSAQKKIFMEIFENNKDLVNYYLPNGKCCSSFYLYFLLVSPSYAAVLL